MENLLDSKKEIFAHLDTIYANIEKAHRKSKLSIQKSKLLK